MQTTPRKPPGGGADRPPYKRQRSCYLLSPEDEVTEERPSAALPCGEANQVVGLQQAAQCATASASGRYDDSETSSDEETKGGRLCGPSDYILGKLKKRMKLHDIAAGDRLGRSSQGSNIYLTNGRLNEADVHFLQKHFEQVVPNKRYKGN